MVKSSQRAVRMAMERGMVRMQLVKLAARLRQEASLCVSRDEHDVYGHRHVKLQQVNCHWCDLLTDAITT